VRVLVSGAAGGIGEGIVRALLGGGATVFATSRSEERLAELRERIAPEMRPALTGIAGDAGDFAGAAEIVARVEALGGAEAAVAILGRGWWTSGPLLELEPGEWKAVLDEMLAAHFAFARAVIPMLSRRTGSTYLSLGGGAAFEPMPDAGLVSIAAAGQVMLTRVLAREIGAAAPRIVELVVDGPVNTRESREFAQPNWIGDADIGRVVAELVLHGAVTWESARTNGPLIVMSERGKRSRPKNLENPDPRATRGNARGDR
jgi:NAD(P)-dependent dehydrogenase (short-subunit alcohol dehydrogenase family)